MLIGLTSLFESETDNILAVGEAINIILFFLIVNDRGFGVLGFWGFVLYLPCVVSDEKRQNYLNN